MKDSLTRNLHQQSIQEALEVGLQIAGISLAELENTVETSQNISVHDMITFHRAPDGQDEQYQGVRAAIMKGFARRVASKPNLFDDKEFVDWLLLWGNANCEGANPQLHVSKAMASLEVVRLVTHGMAYVKRTCEREEYDQAGRFLLGVEKFAGENMIQQLSPADFASLL
eukprot:4018151-Amphidinium_carterae.1